MNVGVKIDHLMLHQYLNHYQTNKIRTKDFISPNPTFIINIPITKDRSTNY